MEERIVCSANRDEDTKAVILGIRHWDSFMHEVSDVINFDERRNYCPQSSFKEQGFITNRGRFVDRNEAWSIAVKNNQIIRRVGGDTTDGGTLFSENLY